MWKSQGYFLTRRRQRGSFIRKKEALKHSSSVHIAAISRLGSQNQLLEVFSLQAIMERKEMW